MKKIQSYGIYFFDLPYEMKKKRTNDLIKMHLHESTYKIASKFGFFAYKIKCQNDNFCIQHFL